MASLGKRAFDFDWKAQRWNLVVVLGAMIGGFVAVHFMSDASNVDINPKTIAQLAQLGIEALMGNNARCTFGTAILTSLKVFFFNWRNLGFGSRYAGGCTSGHAISGLSNCNYHH
jgi:hypothetical protein